jgi:hypothetical protein
LPSATVCPQLTQAALKGEGYAGEYKNDGKRLTVGVYFRQDVFDRLHVGFVTFDRCCLCSPSFTVCPLLLSACLD